MTPYLLSWQPGARWFLSPFRQVEQPVSSWMNPEVKPDKIFQNIHCIYTKPGPVSNSPRSYGNFRHLTRLQEGRRRPKPTSPRPQAPATWEHVWLMWPMSIVLFPLIQKHGGPKHVRRTLDLGNVNICWQHPISWIIKYLIQNPFKKKRTLHDSLFFDLPTGPTILSFPGCNFFLCVLCKNCAYLRISRHPQFTCLIILLIVHDHESTSCRRQRLFGILGKSLESNPRKFLLFNLCQQKSKSTQTCSMQPEWSLSSIPWPNSSFVKLGIILRIGRPTQALQVAPHGLAILRTQVRKAYNEYGWCFSQVRSF